MGGGGVREGKERDPRSTRIYLKIREKVFILIQIQFHLLTVEMELVEQRIVQMHRFQFERKTREAS